MNICAVYKYACFNHHNFAGFCTTFCPHIVSVWIKYSRPELWSTHTLQVITTKVIIALAPTISLITKQTNCKMQRGGASPASAEVQISKRNIVFTLFIPRKFCWLQLSSELSTFSGKFHISRSIKTYSYIRDLLPATNNILYTYISIYIHKQYIYIF